jgi:small-conductance mechanosensitive channel
MYGMFLEMFQVLRRTLLWFIQFQSTGVCWKFSDGQTWDVIAKMSVLWRVRLILSIYLCLSPDFGVDLH